MNEAAVQLVDKLATKLGTTAVHLWGVLLKQAPIAATFDLLMAVSLFAAVIVSARLLYRTEPDDPWIVWLLWGVVAAFATVIAIFSLYGAAGAFINPEFWALKQIIK